MTAALICARCGAPLPLEAAASPAVRCAYCEATLLVQGSQVSVHGTAQPTPKANSGPTPSQAFTQEVAERVSKGGDPYSVLREAAARHLGVAGQSDAVARVTLGLANEFDREHGSKTRAARDGMALSRMAEAYLKAIAELAVKSSTDINLPYLISDANGVHHFQRTIDPAIIARLASVAPAAEDPKQPTKKKGWWPF